MDTSAKVIIVNGQALFEILHALFELLHLLIAHADVIERVCLWRSLIWIFSLDFDGLVERLDRFLPL